MVSGPSAGGASAADASLGGPSAGGPSGRRRAGAGIALAVALFVGLGVVLFCSTGHDDSHITYWAAHTLATAGDILNYNGARIEQSSSLLQVVLLAIATRATGVSLPTLGPLSSIASGVVAVVLAARLARRAAAGASPRVGVAVAVAAALATATTPHFVYWGFGGLESTLVAAAALWVVLACGDQMARPSAKHAAIAAVAMATYLAARPESPMVLGCVLGALIVLSVRQLVQGGTRTAVRAALVLCAMGAAETALLLGLRRAMFGVWFPNPVYTKAASLAPGEGLAYVWSHTFPTSSWLLLAALAGAALVVRDLVRSAPPVEAALAAAFSGAYLGFVVLVGGDWMMGGRFLAHVAPMICVLFALALARVTHPRWRAGLLALVVASNLAGVGRLAFGVSSGRPLWTTAGLRPALDARIGDRGYGWFELTNLVHLRDTTVAAELVDLVTALRPHVDRPLVVMSTQAGMVPYHLVMQHPGAIRFVDGCSLVTRDFLPCLKTAELDDHPACRMLPYDVYFREQPRIDSACGTQRPDVIFGLRKRNLDGVLEKNGYVVVYEQRGPMRPGQANALGEDYTFLSDELIAVDAALAARAGIEAKPRWTWDVGVR